VYGPWV